MPSTSLYSDNALLFNRLRGKAPGSFSTQAGVGIADNALRIERGETRSPTDSLRYSWTMIRPANQERRRKIRTKVPRMIRVRPSEPTRDDFDEILPTINAAKNSVYFVPQNGVFYPDMRVFVTFPYASDPGSINQEFLGNVTRVDKLPGNKQGVAVELLMPIYVGTKETIR